MNSRLRTPVAAGRWLTLLLLAGFVGVLLRTAWMQDDAYITMRTVHNLCAGDGLTWNVGERVQTNMHPGWVFVLAIPYALIGNAWVAALVTGGVLATLAFAMAMAAVPGAAARVFAAVVLVLSCAFVDYSTSGLENPLTYVLLLLLARVYLQALSRAPGAGSQLAMAACSAALMLGRYDTLLLCALPLAHVVLRCGWRARTIAALALGFSPLLAWLLFATFYYGTPIPTPAAAKVLGLDFPRGELLQRGLAYLGDSWSRDPITLAVLGVAVFVAFVRRRAGDRCLVASAAIYVAYTVWVGGCFMSGRFFAAPLLLAVFVLTREAVGRWPWWLATTAAMAMTIAAGATTLTAGREYHTTGIPAHGVTDCRAFYFQFTGWWSNRRLSPADLGELEPAERARPPLLVWSAVGYDGFRSGARCHVVDNQALCEPLLARLPGWDPTNWRVGHVGRHCPDGYLATLATGEQRIVDPAVAEYWRTLRLMTRAPLFDPERLAALLPFAFGAREHLLRDYVRRQYRNEARPVVELAALADSAPPGTVWHDPRVRQFDTPLRVRIGRLVHAPRIELGVDANDAYDVVLTRGGAPVVRLTIDPDAVSSEAGIAARRLTVPSEVAAGGYDEMIVAGRGGDGLWAMAHVRLGG
ncbi:MAG: hypothetical protein IPK26_03485 [Planctomycetes bacterium]|nr:hypothetical protein [Planctomycetota bacterium]